MSLNEPDISKINIKPKCVSSLIFLDYLIIEIITTVYVIACYVFCINCMKIIIIT